MNKTELVKRGLECLIDDCTPCPDSDCPYNGRLVCKLDQVLRDARDVINEMEEQIEKYHKGIVALRDAMESMKK